MAYYPFAVETGARYELLAPSGALAVFNDPLDPNYVGMLTEVTGLDSPEVRESAEDLVEADGRQHGRFYFGGRPIVLNGKVFGHASELERRIRMDRARRAAIAMKADSLLTWKPSTRRENLVTNPRGIVDTTGWATMAVPEGGVNTGATLTRVTGISPSVGTTGFQVVTTGSGATIQGGFFLVPVVAGKTYSASLDAQRTAGTSTLGHPFVREPGGTITQMGAVTSSAWVTRNVTFTATATGFASLGFRQTDSNVSAATYRISDAMVSEGNNQNYFDGDSAGYYWQGNTGVSASGDYVELAAYVRRQQPFRESGGWNKDFQIPLVSAFSVVVSRAQRSTAMSAGPHTVENRGNYETYPIVRITGASTNPRISMLGKDLWTTGLTLAAAEVVEFDMLNHTGVFISGARAGQSANRYIDFVQTNVWPYIDGASSQVINLTGGGTYQIFWRDAWV